jgi:hypothetical protein
MTPDPFSAADYYGTDESGEGADYDCPAGAIDEAYRNECDEVTVYGFVLEQPSGWLLGIAKDAAEAAVDSVYERAELGLDETHYADDTMSEVRRAVFADVCRILRGHGFYRLVGQRTYSIDEVREILGEES